jgi:hypothetical protein
MQVAATFVDLRAEEIPMSLIQVTESAASQIKRLLDAEGKASSTSCPSIPT